MQQAQIAKRLGDMLPAQPVLAAELNQLRVDQSLGPLGFEQERIATLLPRIVITNEIDDLFLMIERVSPALQTGGHKSADAPRMRG